MLISLTIKKQRSQGHGKTQTYYSHCSQSGVWVSVLSGTPGRETASVSWALGPRPLGQAWKGKVALGALGRLLGEEPRFSHPVEHTELYNDPPWQVSQGVEEVDPCSFSNHWHHWQPRSRGSLSLGAILWRICVPLSQNPCRIGTCVKPVLMGLIPFTH